MPKTRTSLLIHLRDLTNETRWKEFIQIYAPVIASTARRHGVSDEEVNDVQQDVYLQLTRTLQKFEKDPSKGRFRSYLAKITISKIRNHQNKENRSPVTSTEIETFAVSNCQVDEFEGDVKRRILQLALQEVSVNSIGATWQCFEEHVLKHRKAGIVAEELGITQNAVFVNCSRILKRVQTVTQKLLGEANGDQHLLSN